MSQLLYESIILEGTINEPKGKPEPQFALPSTVNWMRSLAIAAKPVNYSVASSHYEKVQKRNFPKLEENSVFEQLFLSLHHLSTLERLKSFDCVSDFARLGIIGWYYGLSNAAKAMITAQNGAWSEDHAGVARIWDLELAAKGFAVEPFDWRLSSLVESSSKPEVDRYRNGSRHLLSAKPSSIEDAHGALAGYLSGCADWYRWNLQEKIKDSKEFKALKVENFRTKSARTIRDDVLEKKPIGFMHQAIRYRGKANYREALFLAYGGATETILSTFIFDQATVLRAFLAMAGAFASKRLGKDRWAEFLADVDKNRSFTTSGTSVWN